MPMTWLATVVVSTVCRNGSRSRNDPATERNSAASVVISILMEITVGV
jgi:hypothetical protein